MDEKDAQVLVCEGAGYSLIAGLWSVTRSRCYVRNREGEKDQRNLELPMGLSFHGCFLGSGSGHTSSLPQERGRLTGRAEIRVSATTLCLRPSRYASGIELRLLVCWTPLGGKGSEYIRVTPRAEKSKDGLHRHPDRVQLDGPHILGKQSAERLT